MKCCICDNEIEVEPNGWDEGNNAMPLKDGRCCDECNGKVIMERVRIMERRKWEN